MAHCMCFDTSLFIKNTPCLYFNIHTRELPPSTPESRKWLSDRENRDTPLREAGRISIRRTAHWTILRTLARYLKTLFHNTGLQYTITTPHMSAVDIDAYMIDPATDVRQRSMAGRRIPVLLAVQGAFHVTNYLQGEIISFLMRQSLGKSYSYVERGHFYIRDIVNIAHTQEPHEQAVTQTRYLDVVNIPQTQEPHEQALTQTTDL